MFRKKQVAGKQVQKIKISITDLNHRGEGVGRGGGQTLFVRGALPGEEAWVEVQASHRSYAEARLISLESTAPHRVIPRCKHFSYCGGCALQHLAYERQMTWKQQRVRENLRRLGGIDTEIRPTLGMDNPWQYRTRSRLHLEMDGKHLKVGFFKRQSNKVIDITCCPVQHPLNMRVIEALRQAGKYLTALQGPDSFKLPLEVSLHTSLAAGRCQVGLQKQKDILKQEMLQEFADLVAAAAEGSLSGIIVLPGRGAKNPGTTLNGQDYLAEDIGSFRFRISAPSFFQVNPQQAAVLYRKALELCGCPRTAIDLYCGVGSFSLFLSRIASSVVGVDSNGIAIEDARHNAALNSAANISFLAERAETNPGLLLHKERPLTIVLNPPSRGCSPEILRAVITANPELVVYISCNPATLARDLAFLVQHAYRVEAVQPVDMFPHTSHIESVSALRPAP